MSKLIEDADWCLKEVSGGGFLDSVEDLGDCLRWQSERVKILAEALDFYADESVYSDGNENQRWAQRVAFDKGDRARVALKRAEGVK